MASTGSKKHYGFPIRTVAQLAEPIREGKIPVTKDDIMQPTTAAVYRLLEYMVDFFLDIQRESVSQVPFHVLDMMENREVHEDAFGQLAFDRIITKLMTDIGVHDFSIRDFVYLPTSDTMRVIISAFINYRLFTQDSTELVESFGRTINEYECEYQKLQDTNYQKKDEIARIQAKKREEKPYVDAIREEIKALEQEIVEKGVVRDRTAQEANKLKDECQQIQSRISSLKIQSDDLRLSIRSIQEQIVPSPEGQIHETALLEANIKSEKENIQNCQSKQKEVDIRLRELDKISNDLKMVIKLIRETQSKYLNQNDFEIQIKELRATLDESQRSLRELKAQEDHAAKLLRGKSEQLAQLKQKRVYKTRAAEKELQEANQKRSALEQVRGSEIRRIHELRQQIEMRKRMMADEEEQHRDHMESITSRIQDLGVQVSQYHRALFASMSKAE